MVAIEIGLLIALVYSVVESLEKFGLDRGLAHLIAIPLGILSSFVLLQCTSIREYVVNGLIIGIGAVGSCDTACNIAEKVKKNFRRSD